MSEILPFSAACDRNKGPILEALGSYFCDLTNILEIGSGTAQHAVHFSSNNPHICWQTSDQAIYLDDINTQLNHAALTNVLSPLTIDVNQSDWGTSGKRYDALYTANTLHIMAWHDVLAFFKGLPAVLDSNGYVFIYGPFKMNGVFSSESNQTFDDTLRSRNCGSAIRDLEQVIELAQHAGLNLLKNETMPANNQLLILKKQSDI